jgi:hypothetical protein
MKGLMTKTGRIAAALVLGFLLVRVAHAGEPVINAQELGIVEAVLKICGKSDPTAAAKLHDRIAQLTKGASKYAMARARASEGYRSAYDSVQQLVGTVDESKAKKVCSESVAVSSSPAAR